MKCKLLISILVLIALESCNLNTKKREHSNILIALNTDYTTYCVSLKSASNDIYKQIDEIEVTDSSIALMKKNVLAIKQHADKLVEAFDKHQSKIRNENKLDKISNITKQEAYRMKEDMNGFKMHILHLNSKTTSSKVFDNRINSTINLYDYIPDDTWEQTLILNKTNQNLLMIIKKLEFEVRFAENITIQFWFNTIKMNNYDS